MSSVRQDAQELVILHLGRYDESVESKGNKIPFALTESGMSRKLGKEQSKISSALQELQDQGFVVSTNKKVRGKSRDRNVYFLSEKGLEEEERVREELKEEKIKVDTANDRHRIALENIDDYVDTETPLVTAAANLDEDRVLDVSKLGKSEEEDIFVGRQEELEKLEELVEEVKKNGSLILFIEGEAGVGKTTLINEFKPYALEERFDFLSGGCYSDISEPFLPFKEAFEEFMGKRSEKEFSFLSFLAAPDGLEVENKKMFDAQRQATFYKTTQDVKKIASTNPLVVFLDDMHWTDQATLQILGYMAENLREEEILFICAYRPENISDDHPLKEIIHRSKERKVSEKLELSPLDKSATREIIENEAGVEKIPEELVRKIHQKTDGNPLFVKEYTREMKEKEGFVSEEGLEAVEGMSIPDVVRNVIERRVDRLDDDARKVLELGSVIGEEIPFPLLSHASPLDEFDLLDRIDVLTGEGLWREAMGEEKFYFHHDVIRDAVYRGMMERKKRVYHRKVAESIREIHSDRIEEKYLPLAKHREGCKEYEKALDLYFKAGKKAEEVYAHEDAIDRYERALTVGDKLPKREIEEKVVETLEELGNAYEIIGKDEDAVERYRSALNKSRDDRKQAELHRKIAEVHEKEGRYDEGLERCKKGLDLLKEDCDEKVEILNVKGWIFFRKGDYDKAKKFLMQGRKIAEQQGNEKLTAKALHKLGSIHYREGNYDKALAHLKDALDIRETIGDEKGMAKSINNIGTVHWYKGELDSALELFQDSLEIERKIGNKAGIGQSLNNIGAVYWDKGELDKALDNYERSLEIKEEIGDSVGIANTLHNTGLIYYSKGELDAALDSYERSLEIKEDIGDKEGRAISLTGIGDVYREEGNIEKAEEKYKESLEICSDLGSDLDSIEDHCGLALTSLEKENYERAIRHARNAVDISANIGMKGKEGMSHRILGVVYREKGELNKAVEEFKDAMKMLDETGNRAEKAKATYEYALLFKERGEKGIAEGYVKSALESFEKSGMGPWAEKCEQALQDLGTETD
ncbi:MAG: BREX system ATP-binding domain-containing protein [Candidatus Thermoplasmatota archaeon]